MLFYVIKTQQEGVNERFIMKRNDIASPARYETTASRDICKRDSNRCIHTALRGYVSYSMIL